MMKIDMWGRLAIVLLVIGGLNWGLVGIFNYDLVSAIFGVMSWFTRLVFIIVGISALYEIVMMFAMMKED